MKKIIIAVAAIALSLGLQAASVDWKLSTGATYAGQNVYALAGISANEVLAAVSSSDASAWNSLVAGINPSKAAAGSRGTAMGTTEGISQGDSLVFLIVNGDIAVGSSYTVLKAGTITSVYEPPATGSTQTFAPNTLGVAGTGTFASVPEPTSGLLLLLGMAGIALRRKQA